MDMIDNKSPDLTKTLLFCLKSTIFLKFYLTSFLEVLDPLPAPAYLLSTSSSARLSSGSGSVVSVVWSLAWACSLPRTGVPRRRQ